MSRMTANIMKIKKDLDQISGLDGIAADKVETLACKVHEMVEDILSNHSNACVWDYKGNGEYPETEEN